MDDWFMRYVESFAENAARKFLDKPKTQEYVDAPQLGGDDLVYSRLCALLSKREFCAAEDLLWEHLRPGDPDGLLLAEEIYRQLGEFGDDVLEAHGFSRREVSEGMDRAREYVKAIELEG